MPEQKHETRARKAKLAISYITAGTLMVVWSIIWLLYLTLSLDVTGAVYLATGVVLSGIAVVVIGMKVGDIGKEANVDEDDPAVVATVIDPASQDHVGADVALAELVATVRFLVLSQKGGHEAGILSV